MQQTLKQIDGTDLVVNIHNDTISLTYNDKDISFSTNKCCFVLDIEEYKNEEGGQDHYRFDYHYKASLFLVLDKKNSNPIKISLEPSLYFNPDNKYDFFENLLQLIPIEE